MSKLCASYFGDRSAAARTLKRDSLASPSVGEQAEQSRFTAGLNNLGNAQDREADN